jgi:RNA polymerase sigma-70 factor, ECF subfamily
VSDEQLLASIVQGNPRAIEELYREYRPRLAAFLSRLAPHCENIDEMINDTLMVVWQRADRFRGSSKVSTWIFGIAYRVAMKTLRQNRRWSANLAYAQIEATTDPTQQAEEYDWLTQGLARLSPDHCASLMLIYHKGHSAREVSAMTQSPVGTIKARLWHACNNMRHHLGELSGHRSRNYN